ncbi:MAG TPA: MYXO-CTERM sorting domain-containing protein, partial [Kofleriaceae bacterium]|nr:MYXO-CTERM sorting domain-containing protein [Kofleriaceae bacterium]
LAYTAPRGKAVTHVILDGPAAATGSTITATKSGDGCSVEVTPGTAFPGKPLVVTLDETCAVKADPEGASAAGGSKPGLRTVRPSRGGCCGAEAAPGSSIAMTLVVGVIALRRRRRK